jgi:cell division control protein 6
MKFLAWDETLFRNPEVFDPDYLPEDYLHRDVQLSRLAANLKPVIRGAAPVHTLCLGPPGTGKTTAVKLVLKELVEYPQVIPVYVNCQIINTKQQVFIRIFEQVVGFSPPSFGTPFQKIYYRIMNKVAEEEKVLVVALDDINMLLDDKIMNEVLYAILKAHEEVEGVKVGVIGVATDVKLSAKLDERVGSIFHYDEVFFPLYGRDEIEDILRRRVELGFYPGAITEEAFQRVIDLTNESGDLRQGIHLLKLSGMEAERRGSRKVELQDVENVYGKSKIVFLRKNIAALNDFERGLLEIIYRNDDLQMGELYELFSTKHTIGYTKFYEMVEKLENLRLIDLVYAPTGRKGRTRIVIKRYDAELLLEALKTI